MTTLLYWAVLLAIQYAVFVRLLKPRLARLLRSLTEVATLLGRFTR